MRSFLSSLGVAGVMAACLVSGSALASAGGINGRSGKQGQNVSCQASTCHSGGTSTPTVTIEGPSSLAPGATGNYKLIVRGGPGARAGFNVAVSDNGGTLNAGSGQYKLSGELTHTTPKAFTNGEAVFDFSLVAPANAGTVTLFGAGNSANNNGSEAGDASALSSLQVTIGSGGGGGGGGDDEGGCAAAGGAPLLGAALLMLGARLRRRR